MSIDKDQSRRININTNIIEFPNVKQNEKLKQQKFENEKLVQSIAIKMDNDRFDQLPLIREEILLLSNSGETIEFPPHIAARLISVLASTYLRNSIMEDLLWVGRKEKAIVQCLRNNF